MPSRRTLLKSAATAPLLAPAIFTSRTARAQGPTTLRVGSWLPGHHLINAGIIRPWAEAVAADSDGTLRFDIMTAAVGRPPEYYDFTANGVIDVGYGVLGHNPGRFLMTEVMGLPFMSPDHWAGSAASWLAFQRYGERYGEHRGVKVIGTWVHSEPYIFMRGDPLASIADLTGKKIRVGSAITGRIVSALGGTPVQLPPTEAQQAMASGVADGITFPMESIEFFKITPAIKSSNRVPGGLLYTDTFWVGVNQRRWDGLSPVQKAAIEKHSGLGLALSSAWAWQSGDQVGRAALERAGVRFVNLPDADGPKIRAALKGLGDDWLAKAKEKNLPGEEIMAYASAMAERYRSVRRVNVL
jgi:TRAP-type C4-dicarboxylate transport system substrate-binding protein